MDISFEQKTHFLGMTTFKNEGDYLIYHQVNVCLMSIVFGVELGLTKPQLRDLGYIALFHDAGMASIPPELSAKKGALSPEEKAVVHKAPLVSIRGNMAQVWGEYEFLRDGKFTHCGVDMVTLFQTPEGWKIAAIAYTTETKGCKGQ